MQGYLTTREAAEVLGVSKARVDQYCRKGRIPFAMAGQSRMILKADVAAFKRKPKGKPGRPAKGPVPGKKPKGAK
jgi:excisionase family DNA binding protein